MQANTCLYQADNHPCTSGCQSDKCRNQIPTWILTGPTDGQTASPSPPADLDSDVTSVASIGESEGESDYVESAENLPTIPDNTPNLAVHTSKIEEMHEVSEGQLVKLARPTVILSHINEL